MRALDLVRLAFRNLWRQRLRTSLTIFAVVIGATSVTIMLSLVTSVKSFMMGQFEANGQLQTVAVSAASDLDYDHARYGGGSSDTGIKLDDAMVAKLKKISHVEAVTPLANVWAFDALLYQGKKLAINQVMAYEPNGVLNRTVLAGRDLAPGDGTGIITLTPAYANKLGYKGNYSALVGQTVTLRTMGGYSGEGATIPPPQMGPGDQGGGKDKGNQGPQTDLPAKVVGVVNGDSDAAIYLPLSWARGVMKEQHWETKDQPGHYGPSQPELVTSNQLDDKGYQSIMVRVDSTKHVNDVAATIKTYGVGAATAADYIKQQQGIFTLLSAVFGAIGGIALAVAAIGVINTMVMAILERTREIGVMRACGATRATIRRMFTLEATLIGFWGGVIGVLLGFGLILIANPVLNTIFKTNSIAAANIIGLPVWLIVGVVAATSLVGLLAGLYPAWRAARLDPVEALRYE